MPNERRGIAGICLVVLMLFLVNLGMAEIIKVSSMKGERGKFSVLRNIFSPLPRVPQQRLTPHTQPTLPKPEVKEVKANLENEVRRSVFYEGYISKGEKRHALLNVSGEYFVVTEGDIVLQRIKVIKVQKKSIVIEVESCSYDIARKGENGEN